MEINTQIYYHVSIAV